MTTLLSTIRQQSIKDAGAGGLTVYATLDDLPTSGFSSGDQAFVTSTSRFYISNGSGWYNVALINATPSLTIDPTGTIVLATDGTTPTVITLTATDSDNPVAGLTYSVESDGSFGGLATISQDSSVFTITPLSEDSATTETSILTFKASDGISFGSGTRTITLAFKAQYSNYTKLLIKADTTGTDDQVDASTNTHTITEAGNVTSTALSPYHPGGYSTYFDGTDDYLDAGDIQFGANDFTIEGWFQFNSTANQCLIGRFHNYSSNQCWEIIYESSSLRFQTNTGSFNNGAVSWVPVTNVWYHIAAVRSGSNKYLFVNGVLLSGYPINIGTGALQGESTGTVKIGTRHDLTKDFNGYISDLRIVTGTAVYTSNFTPPTAPLIAIANTELLTCHLPYIADGSSNAHAITVVGNTSTKRFGPYDYEGYGKADHGGSVYFDGSGDNLTLAGNSDFNMGSDFTFECWCYSTSAASGSPGDLLMLVWDGSSNNSVWVSYTSANKFEFRISYVGSWAMTLTSASTFPINQWYHVAATRNSGTTYLFINGVQEATGSNSTDISSTGNVVNIGSQGGGRHFNGYIADARIINGTAVYTSAFTPPTAPLTAITNTKLLTCTNKNSIWDASGARELITVGGTAAASNTQRKFTSSSAIAYDGNSDYLQIPANDFFNFGTDDFTMETWVYAVATGANYPSFMSTVTGWSSGANGHRFDNTGYANKFGFYVNGFAGRAGGNPFMHTTNNFNHDTWYHYAVTRSGNTFRMFIDGVLEDTQTSSGSLNIALGGFRSGWSFDGANGYFNGYIQDMRITRGVARYTATFTPPAIEHSG